MSQGEGRKLNLDNPGANEGHSQKTFEPQTALEGLRVVYPWAVKSGITPGLKDCLVYAANTISFLAKELENAREMLLIREKVLINICKLLEKKVDEPSLQLDLDVNEKPRYAYQTEP